MKSSNVRSFELGLLPSVQNKHLFCAEIIESNVRSFIAHAWKWDSFPSFGSLVFVPHDDYAILGCVTHVETGSLDPSRHPIAYQKTQSELLSEQPQIFELLRTVFTVQVLGYYQYAQQAHEQGSFHYKIPPRPGKIHNFVGICSSSMHELFFKEQDYLHLLFSSSLQEQVIDELLLAIMSNLRGQSITISPIVRSMCAYFPLLVGNDYRRMKRFLKRVAPLIETVS